MSEDGPTPRESGERVEGGHAPPEQLQKGHEAPEYRGHQPPEAPSSLDLGHDPPPDTVFMQPVGEMHSPAAAAPEPTQAPPKPSDAAQSVTPPAPAPSPPPSGDGSND